MDRTSYLDIFVRYLDINAIAILLLVRWKLCFLKEKKQKNLLTAININKVDNAKNNN